MYKYCCRICSVFIFMLATPPLFSQSSELELKCRNSIGFVIEGGINTSRIVAKKWLGKDNIDYRMGYKPGYNWNAYLEFSHRRISLATGIGSKSLNFNVTRHVIFSPPNGSKALVRLNYWTLPVQIKVSLLKKDRLFITMTTEYSWLMNDLFGVINSGGIIRQELYEEFRHRNMFLYLGIGHRLNAQTALFFETGYTPGYIYDEIGPREGDYHQFFTFGKKAVEFRFGLTYELFSKKY